MVDVMAVTSGIAPGFAYTRDAFYDFGREFLVAGREDLTPEEAHDLLLDAMRSYSRGEDGRFRFRNVTKEWADTLLLAVPEDRRAGAVQVIEIGRELLTEARCDRPFHPTR